MLPTPFLSLHHSQGRHPTQECVQRVRHVNQPELSRAQHDMDVEGWRCTARATTRASVRDRIRRKIVASSVRVGALEDGMDADGIGHRPVHLAR